jgi:hypothetical protein
VTPSLHYSLTASFSSYTRSHHSVCRRVFRRSSRPLYESTQRILNQFHVEDKMKNHSRMHPFAFTNGLDNRIHKIERQIEKQTNLLESLKLQRFQMSFGNSILDYLHTHISQYLLLISHYCPHVYKQIKQLPHDDKPTITFIIENAIKYNELETLMKAWMKLNNIDDQLNKSFEQRGSSVEDNTKSETHLQRLVRTISTYYVFGTDPAHRTLSDKDAEILEKLMSLTYIQIACKEKLKPK